MSLPPASPRLADSNNGALLITEGHPDAGGDVEAGLNGTAIPEGNARARVGTNEARLPTEIRVVPPPDKVPAVLAEPPRSEPSPTTTPWEIRPSIIPLARVPALKLMKPSCMTVVPSPR